MTAVNKEKHEREVIIIKNMRKQRLTGVIIPVDWDEGGAVKAIGISTHNEEEYLISNDSKGKDLLHYLRSPVEITGSIIEVAGIKIVKVKDIGAPKFDKEIHFN
jgi:hypothetical protein